MEIARLAREAWELPEGTHELDGFRAVRNPNNVLLFFTPKMLGPVPLSTADVIGHLELPETQIHIVAYPRPEHHEAFAEQSMLNRKDGVSERYPEAIGTLSVSRRLGHMKGELWVNFVQSQMAGTENITTRRWANEHSPKSGLNRSVKTKYAGWRERIFRELIRLAGTQKKDVAITKTNLSGLSNQFKRNGQLMRDIKNAAEKEGVKIDDSKAEIRILTGE